MNEPMDYTFVDLQDDFHTLVDTAEGFDWINERPTATEKKAQVGAARRGVSKVQRGGGLGLFWQPLRHSLLFAADAGHTLGARASAPLLAPSCLESLPLPPHAVSRTAEVGLCGL